MKCEELQPKNRNMKKTKYELDREDSESESETDEDEEGRDLRKDLEKTMIKPGEVAESLRKDGTVKTPVNLQLESVKETEKETTAKLSDSRYMYEFLISKRISFMLDLELEDCIKNGTVVTITEIKKTKDGKKIVKDWMIQRRRQVEKRLGRPVLWEM